MTVQILRQGSKGQDVNRWQIFLIGQGHLRSVADSNFGQLTEKATKVFQRKQGITADGIVGPQTLGVAFTAGFDMGFEDRVDPVSNPILVGESALKPITGEARERLFGHIEFEHASTQQNPERIKILNDWEQQNIKMIFIPQLKGISVFGRPSSGRMRFHQKAEGQLKSMWAAWEEVGLLHLILTYDGSYAPRFIRGSRNKLSNHAFGSAFDINARWNRLGTVPALEGQQGSVRELVEIANEHGFFWGGHFEGRPDGMHFEVAKLL